ncbi:MAG: prephenate dehydratase [Chloroflexota bacterium]|nr:prephenate dehydratase [Chloroflexota bacterium]
MATTIAYLGPPGSFTEQAALLYDGDSELSSFPSISAVAAAVATGMTDKGVVPIENSLEGSVTDTLDLLIHEPGLLIQHELVLPIEHHLLVKPGTRVQDIEVLYAHPQSLAQCREFRERCFPQVPVVAALSNSASVQQMMSHQGQAAAIGTQRASVLYEAEILARSIQDRSSNATRFIVLALTDHKPTECDKTSLCFSFSEDHPGLLYKVLKEFAECSINLTKVESRPSKEGLGEYIFLIDIEGHREDKTVTEVFEKVKSMTGMFKIFGSYPRCPL